MAFDGLTNTSFFAVKLHGTLNLEGRGVGRIPGYSNENEPFLIWSDAVVNYLSTCESRVSVKDFLWGSGWVGDGPVVYRSFRDEANGGIRNPFPKHNVLGVDVGLDFLLCFDIENLECSASFVDGK